MAYSVTRLTTKAECDDLLEKARAEKKSVAYRRDGFEIQQNNYRERSIDVQSELKSVQAQLGVLNTVIPALPEGDQKEEEITKLKKLEVRERQLKSLNEDFGVLALLEKELEVDRATKEEESIDAFIVAIEARKAQLPT
jgi:hypothetical protein